MKLRWAFALAIPLLAACGGSERTCVDPDEPYLAARTNPQLRIPDGMTQPNRSEALAIPAEKQGNKAGRTACLEEPPSYFRSSGTVARSPEEVVASWAQAWANREADAVVALYSTQFVAPTDSAGASAWLEQRREQSLRLTAERRPDLIERARAQGRLTKEDERFLASLPTRS